MTSNETPELAIARSIAESLAAIASLVPLIKIDLERRAAKEKLYEDARAGAFLPQAGWPSNTGKPWTPAEDSLLRTEFETEKDAEALAVLHGRTQGAITSRLVRLGLLRLIQE